MALSEVQAALARLFTDEAARTAFFKDPRGAARALGLDESDAATLTRIAPKAIRQFARTLKARRALDARKMLPLTAEALGDAFVDHFRAAAAALGPEANRLMEAQALAALLATLAKAQVVKPEWIGELARYEAAFVEAAQPRLMFRMRLFHFHVGTVAAALRAGAPPGEVGRKATLAVWLRWPGRRLFHRLWPLAPPR